MCKPGDCLRTTPPGIHNQPGSPYIFGSVGTRLAHIHSQGAFVTFQPFWQERPVGEKRTGSFRVSCDRRSKLAKIGAKVVRHARYVTFQVISPEWDEKMDNPAEKYGHD